MKDAKVSVTFNVPVKIALQLRNVLKRNDITAEELIQMATMLVFIADEGCLFAMKDEDVAQVSLRKVEVGE